MCQVAVWSIWHWLRVLWVVWEQLQSGLFYQPAREVELEDGDTGWEVVQNQGPVGLEEPHWSSRCTPRAFLLGTGPLIFLFICDSLAGHFLPSQW